MTKPITVLKSCGPKLVPFFKTCAIFFVLYADTRASETTQPYLFCVFKCLPVISLIIFVLLHGMNFTEYYKYARRILVGLIFCVLGDACLVWKDNYFEVGIGCFAIGQLFYAKAFGWRPLRPLFGLAFFGLGSLVYSYLKPGLHGIMVYMVAAYIGVIGVMAWRACARVHWPHFFDARCTWTQLSGCLGAMVFVVSDLTLAFDKFICEFQYAHPIIMVTYYAAQFGIALSCVDCHVDEIIASSKREQQKKEQDNLNGLNKQEMNGIEKPEMNGSEKTDTNGIAVKRTLIMSNDRPHAE